ncbi:40S ribosomal S12-like [Chlorella sorokiniana]|uniref:40S ribosomal protein S12 n=1 Tax=Chlorella sorokiniana TaxID=3076 RepID=A0A2P6TN14_CHLSO|nr:40S ribosomal S12-like [Chlorella sorokiniana]|eukprot:PRW45727.1 40S ribosomal S12-like [Chlorella sorokiniana]
MSDGGESPKSVQEAPAAAAPGEPMDLNTAIQVVMKKALAHDGLARGLHESARAIERGQAQLAILADDCNQPDYKKLIEALCAEQSVNLISVPEQQTLGQWAGLCKIDSEGEARKVVKCSCAVITDYGEETEGLAILQEYLKSRTTGIAWWQPVGAGLDCSAACARVDKTAWAINGGAASQALCSVMLNNKPYHGTKPITAGACSFTYIDSAGQAKTGVARAAAGAFYCGCTTAGTCWVPGSCPNGSTSISPINACVAEKSACASTFADGTIAKCAANGRLYRVESGKLRQFPSKEVYASYGSPPPTFEDRSTSCCQLSRCGAGAALPMGNCTTLFGFAFYPRKDSGWENIPGPGGVENAPYRGLTAQQLAAICGPKPHCEGFVRNGQTGEGWLKTGIRPPADWGSLPAADGCSGLWVRNPPILPAKCGKLERGIHFAGGDLTTCPELGGTCFYTRGVNTIEDCCNKCADKAGCGAFTFKWQDEAHTLGSCALKAATGFTRSYWGEHHSAVIVPQCRVPFCTAYAQGTCKCTACQQGWLPTDGKCLSATPVKLSASDPAFVDKARTVGPRQTLLVTNYLLEGDSKPSTLELKRKHVFHKTAKIVVQRPGGTVTKPAPDSRLFSGQVSGIPGSIAVLHVRSNGGVSGIALRGNGSWALGRQGGTGTNLAAPLGSRKSRPEDGTNMPPFIKGHDTQPATSGGVAAQAGPAVAATVGAASAQPAQLLQTVFDQKWQAVVGLEMDNSFMQQFKKEEDAIDYAADLIGYADSVYSREIQVDLVIGYIVMWPTSTHDPYSSLQTSQRVLEKLRDEWNTSRKAVKRTFAFLLSNLDLGGRGYLEALCGSPSDSKAYAVCTNMGTGFKWEGDQANWRCGDTDVTNGFIDMSRLCGTASYTRKTGWFGCFESGNVEQFSLQYYPDNTPAIGSLLAANNPVPPCVAAGVQPVLSIQITGQGSSDRWEMDSSQLELQLEYVERAGGKLHIRSRTFKMCKSQGVVVFPNTSPTFVMCDQQPIKACSHPDNDNNDYCSYCEATSTGAPKICVANGGNPCRDAMSATVELCNGLVHSDKWTNDCPNWMDKSAYVFKNQDKTLSAATARSCGKPLCDGTRACVDCRCPTGMCDAVTKRCPCDGAVLTDCTKCNCPKGQTCNSSQRCEVPPPTPQPCPDPTNQCDASCACPTDQACKQCYLHGAPLYRCINSFSRPCNPAEGVMNNPACAPFFIGDGSAYRVCNSQASNGYSFCAVIWICNTGVCRINDFLGISNACVCVGNTCNEATGKCQ